MKLKELLYETAEKSKLEELDSLIQNGDWIVNFDIPIYRGSKTQEDLFKVKETTKRKGTRDTIDYVDELIHRFYVECYSKYPDRRSSRFGSTYRDNIETYLDPGLDSEKEAYVILPSNSAKISHRIEDPFTVLQGVKSYSDKIFKYPIDALDSDQSVLDYIGKNSDYIYKVLRCIRDLRETGSTNIKVSEIGCPEKMLEKVEVELNKIEESNLNNYIFYLIKNISLYFSDLNFGYPEKPKEGGEVMWDGKYIQVKENFYEKYVYYKTGK